MSTAAKTARRQSWQRFIHLVGPQGSGKSILSRQIAAGVRQERMARVDRGDVGEWLAAHEGSWDKLLAAYEQTSVFIFMWTTEPDIELRADDLVIHLRRGPAPTKAKSTAQGAAGQLAAQIMRLNPDVGVIGAGMLANLQTLALRIQAEAAA